MMGNTTAMFYINKQREGRSTPLPGTCISMELLYLSHNCSASAVVYLTVLHNVLVDHFSIPLTSDHWWPLKNTIIQLIFLRWGHLTVDLVAHQRENKVSKALFWRKTKLGISVQYISNPLVPRPNVHLLSNSSDPKSTQGAQAEFSQGDHSSSSMAEAFLVLTSEKFSSLWYQMWYLRDWQILHPDLHSLNLTTWMLPG